MGQPCSGAAVFWIERNADNILQRRATVDTDAQGRFRFAEALPKPDEGRYVTLMAQAPDWGLGLLTARPGAPATALTLTLQTPTALHVTFTDPTGKPAANLHVRVAMLYGRQVGFLEIPAEMHGRWEQRTDANGQCVFLGLPQGMQARFEVEEESYAALSFEDAVALGKEATQQAGPIRLQAGGIVQGRVTLPDGRPAAGVRVVAQSVPRPDGSGNAVTDAAGNYRMAHLQPGSYNIAIYPGRALEKTVTARALEKVEVKPGVPLLHQDFAMIPARSCGAG